MAPALAEISASCPCHAWRLMAGYEQGCEQGKSGYICSSDTVKSVLYRPPDLHAQDVRSLKEPGGDKALPPLRRGEIGSKGAWASQPGIKDPQASKISQKLPRCPRSGKAADHINTGILQHMVSGIVPSSWTFGLGVRPVPRRNRFLVQLQKISCALFPQVQPPTPADYGKETSGQLRRRAVHLR